MFFSSYLQNRHWVLHLAAAGLIRLKFSALKDTPSSLVRLTAASQVTPPSYLCLQSAHVSGWWFPHEHLSKFSSSALHSAADWCCCNPYYLRNLVCSGFVWQSLNMHPSKFPTSVLRAGADWCCCNPYYLSSQSPTGCMSYTLIQYSWLLVGSLSPGLSLLDRCW
jgi:hypothetical protein